MKKKYAAVWGRGTRRIMSTRAASEAVAREEFRNQLSRPGREKILKRWQADGERVVEVRD
jgi:hypothetical protein